MVDYVGLFIVKKEPKDEPSTIASVASTGWRRSLGTRSSLRTTRCDEALGRSIRDEDKIIVERNQVDFGKNQRVQRSLRSKA